MKNSLTPLHERFWAKVKRGGPDDCWIWIGSRLKSGGYGQISAGRRGQPPLRAHCLSWQFSYGEIPRGLCVLHRCDNPPCVNPEHLFLGTRDDNAKDMAAKGRSGAHQHPDRLSRGDGNGLRKHPESVLRGSRAANAKLNEECIKVIRYMKTKSVSNERLAKVYRISETTVARIVNLQSWAHVV